MIGREKEQIVLRMKNEVVEIVLRKLVNLWCVNIVKNHAKQNLAWKCTSGKCMKKQQIRNLLSVMDVHVFLKLMEI